MKRRMTLKRRGQPLIMEALTTLGRPTDFDRRFWRRAGAQARFTATWRAIEEWYKIKGVHGYQLRLRRSAERLQQAQG